MNKFMKKFNNYSKKILKPLFRTKILSKLEKMLPKFEKRLKKFFENSKNKKKSEDFWRVFKFKPWLEDFLCIEKFDLASEFFHRVEKNFIYFKWNYLIIYISVVFLLGLCHLDYLLCIIALVGIWMYLDSIKKFVVFGEEIKPADMNIAVGIAWVIFTLILLWKVMIYACVYVLIGCVVHAGLHSTPRKEKVY